MCPQTGMRLDAPAGQHVLNHMLVRMETRGNDHEVSPAQGDRRRPGPPDRLDRPTRQSERPRNEGMKLTTTILSIDKKINHDPSPKVLTTQLGMVWEKVWALAHRLGAICNSRESAQMRNPNRYKTMQVIGRRGHLVPHDMRRLALGIVGGDLVGHLHGISGAAGPDQIHAQTQRPTAA